MARKTIHKEADRQPTNNLNHLLVTDYRKTQQDDRLQELEADYLQNLKHLQGVINKAYRRFIKHTQQLSFEENRKLI